MKKTILITGSTDGIGLEAARLLASHEHRVLVHGRTPSKVDATSSELATDGFVADLSAMSEVRKLATAVSDAYPRLDVLINNAGVFVTRTPTTADGLDVRFAVNTIAPYLLTRELLPRMDASGRIVNLSSAAQSSVEPAALAEPARLTDGPAYAQSKLALTMWSRSLAQSLGENGPAVIAVNPGSMLATKMVKDAYGVAGADIRIGADILRRAAVDDEFANATGQYYDNDQRRFASPHPDALDPDRCREVVDAIERVLATH